MSSLSSLEYDLDLFFNFDIFKIHCATAGGEVPNDIFKNSFHNEERIRALKSNLEFDYKINPFFDEILSLKLIDQKIDITDFDRELYLRDFIFYAKKGYLSFDRTYITKSFDRNYHLVAYPVFNSLEENNNFNLIYNSSYYQLDSFIDEVIKKFLNQPQIIFY